MRTRQVSVLLLGLSLAGQVAMSHIEANALSVSTRWPHPAPHPYTAPMPEVLFQFRANHALADGQVPFFTTRPDTALFMPRSASAMVLAHQYVEIPIEDPADDFILSLILSSPQRDANTQIGHPTIPDRLLQAEPSPSNDSAVQMKLEGSQLVPPFNSMGQPPETPTHFPVDDPVR